MLLKLAILLGAICTISSETVEIECFVSGDTCLVEDIPEELPANANWKFLCPQNCTRIRIPNGNFPRFPRELWNTHQHVTELYVDRTDFEELAYGDFFNAAKLIDFTLRYNKKPLSLRDNCFWGAFKLNELDLYDNQISEMEGSAFNGIPLLTQLELQNNEISYISNDHFRNLPNLRYLYLQFNAIEKIESEAFLYNAKLNLTHINGNNLTELDLLLPGIDIGQISLYGNQLTKVSIRSDSQEINDFDHDDYIYLEENELTEIYIQPNIVVKQLVLWGNPIEQIDTLPMLRSLKLLNLQRCKIRSLNGQRFADKYVNVESLYLTGNNLISFSRETFAGLNKLELLALDNNQLTEFDFQRMVSLNYLDVRNNSLTEFPYGEDIHYTFPALNVLDIRNNNFDEEYLAELVKTLEVQGIEVRWEPEP